MLESDETCYLADNSTAKKKYQRYCGGSRKLAYKWRVNGQEIKDTMPLIAVTYINSNPNLIS